ncbi:MAG: GAF domain-containing protein [Planctomycetota bacterium]|nr:GAF domain-containing protein [Planctomycetota bacterium]
MARRKASNPVPTSAAQAATAPQAGAPEPATGVGSEGLVLLVSADRSRRETLSAVLVPTGLEVRPIAWQEGADALVRASLLAGDVDLVLIDAALPAGAGFDLVREIAQGADELNAMVGLTMFGPSMTTEDALSAMRAGAGDLIDLSATRSDAARARVIQAVLKAKGRREQEKLRRERDRRLRGLCKKLNLSRRQIAGQVASLCEELTSAYREMSDQIGLVTSAAEFRSIIRQDLDVESLLRTFLEYVLARVGSTNAAVFLPATTGDFSLGAYVNYDGPKDSTEVLLDHLASTLAPRFAHETGVTVMSSRAELDAKLGEAAEWLGEQHLLVMPCVHKGECLAVVALFRDRHTPFNTPAVQLMRVVGELFGQHLARVIHVHHRHLPKDKWSSLGDPPADERDDFGLAA